MKIYKKKVSKLGYLLLIHISAKYENPKMHKICDQNCPTYIFMDLTFPSSVSMTITQKKNIYKKSIIVFLWVLGPKTHFKHLFFLQCEGH